MIRIHPRKFARILAGITLLLAGEATELRAEQHESSAGSGGAYLRPLAPGDWSALQAAHRRNVHEGYAEQIRKLASRFRNLRHISPSDSAALEPEVRNALDEIVKPLGRTAGEKVYQEALKLAWESDQQARRDRPTAVHLTEGHVRRIGQLFTAWKYNNGLEPETGVLQALQNQPNPRHLSSSQARDLLGPTRASGASDTARDAYRLLFQDK